MDTEDYMDNVDETSFDNEDVEIQFQQLQNEDVMDDEDPSDDPSDYIRPEFPALSAQQMSGGPQFRRVQVPPHRYTPLRNHWLELMTPCVEHMKLQIRFNPRRRSVEIKTCPATEDPGALQKAADFIRAFCLGFEVQDAIALLRLDDLYIDSFEIKDVKTLNGAHLSRCIGRVAGQAGKTKHAIENATRTRIVLAETRIHILGAFNNIKLARDAVCSLILGSPPGKVYSHLRTVAKRLNERS
eukprot:GILI01001777.1.p1 GENE.GILI01001777.1~~GILI01001777.1.p1  ORF type:complete len:275 (-),score=65.87 GILI01001777.1:372-1097(-)